jgi:hypothetical protein
MATGRRKSLLGSGPRIRVTRLGEFSPAELFFSLQHFTKMIKYSQTVGSIFFNGNFIVVNLTKYGTGYILGNFFTKASGHNAKDSKHSFGYFPLPKIPEQASTLRLCTKTVEMTN